MTPTPIHLANPHCSEAPKHRSQVPPSEGRNCAKRLSKRSAQAFKFWGAVQVKRSLQHLCCNL
jgi:hypothetical protein